MSDITDAELKRAILEVDLLLRRKQNFWEPWRNIAMVTLAIAAVFAAGGLAGWLLPPHPQQITVHIDQPLTVRLVQ